MRSGNEGGWQRHYYCREQFEAEKVAILLHTLCKMLSVLIFRVGVGNPMIDRRRKSCGRSLEARVRRRARKEAITKEAVAVREKGVRAGSRRRSRRRKKRRRSRPR